MGNRERFDTLIRSLVSGRSNGSAPVGSALTDWTERWFQKAEIRIASVDGGWGFLVYAIRTDNQEDARSWFVASGTGLEYGVSF